MNLEVAKMRKRLPPRSISALREELPFGKFIPNALTLLGLCTGATAIRFALSGHWQGAVVAVMIAAVLGPLDGSYARRLGPESKFCAPLVSLAHLVSFGVA